MIFLLSIYGQPYPTFQFHLVLLLSCILLTLFLEGSISHLCMLYQHCKGWCTHSSCWILSVAWHGRDTSRELSDLWILSWCYMDYISFGSFWQGLWCRADILWWVFGHRLLSSYPGFLCVKLIISSWYTSISLLMAFNQCCKQETMYLHFSSKESTNSLSCTTASVSSVGTFAKRLTMSKLIIWLKRMEA